MAITLTVLELVPIVVKTALNAKIKTYAKAVLKAFILNQMALARTAVPTALHAATNIHVIGAQKDFCYNLIIPVLNV